MSQRNSGDQQQPSSQVSTASQTFGGFFGQSSRSVASTNATSSPFSSSVTVTSTASQGFGTFSSGIRGGLFGTEQAGGGQSFQNTSPATFGTGAFGSSGGFGQTAATPPTAPVPADQTTGFGQSSGGLFGTPPGGGFGGRGGFGGGGFGGGGFGGGGFGGGGFGGGGFGAAPQGQGLFGQGAGNQGGFGQGFNQWGRASQARQRKKKVHALSSSARDPVTWLFLVNGGQKTFDDEFKVREKFEKLYKVFVSNGVVKAENVVCATGTNGIMCGVGDTIVNAGSIGKILTGWSGTGNTGNFTFGWNKHNGVQVKNVLMTEADSVIVIFTGEGWIPQMGYNPPSVVPNAGGLAFFNGSSVHFDDLPNLENEFVARRTLFICQASYCGNVIQEATKRVAGDGREMLAMTTGPDHCGFDGSILVDAMVDYFTGTEWKDNTLADMHQFLQEKIHSCTPHYKEIFVKNVEMTEEDYENERQKSVQWSTGHYSYHQPSKIPTAAWKMFEQIEEISEKINTVSSGQMTVDMQDQLTSQLQLMKENKFDLITMFKRKPNYKMSMYGSVDVMGKMKLSDFLHLT